MTVQKTGPLTNVSQTILLTSLVTLPNADQFSRFFLMNLSNKFLIKTLYIG